ncbi:MULTISPECIES: signal peptide peptidase SppA [Moraxella]|uniref:Peptidase S49 n=1 Tax=Moraxella lacunata TaxID=477 RepID=A0A1B8Q7T0_MORLA|nr:MULTISPECIES: signal peptide peptidase SppA [Moraxella]MBE9579631.1 signal peptide peptidase SppA [Moraxella sp. K1664]MBE9587536.1 signal peptide peptidase SppA [Moraxella sp. K1630]MBE9597237.1 signal peptide peptidase SppA [Moraxella sp. K2450]MDI4483707.1 signal peptide peptidase SppA [Moraxella lacunata]MDI4508216.1 signal peptide peptidase SppA [Moraxella lacunata]
MAWPPNPNKDNSNERPNPAPQTPPNQYSGQEWRLLEKTLMASLDEQRKARRWGIFFKLLTFGYIVFIIAVMGRGCSTVSSTMPLEANSPHLAVVEVNGVIASDSDANAYDISSALTEAFENPNAKAVALAINSPGGSPVQSDEIWQTAMELRKDNPDKKLYAVIGDIGASGAYYIASSADEIWVNPSSLVGSIGVIMSSYNTEELMKKIGVQDRTMTSGQYKDILSMSRPMTEDERAHVQQLLDTTHQNFIDAVKEGRGDKLKNAEQNNVFSGLFWTGKESLELGLADKAGGISKLEKELGVEHSVNYTYVDPMRKVFDRLGVQIGKGLGQGVQMSIAENSQSKLQ